MSDIDSSEDSSSSRSERFSTSSYVKDSREEAPVNSDSEFLPYQNEPLAVEEEQDMNQTDEDEDPDPGIIPDVLRQCFDEEVEVNT